MALEAVVFQHSMVASSGNPWLYEQIEVEEGNKAAPDLQQNGPFLDSKMDLDGWDVITTRDGNGIGMPVESATPTPVVGAGRRKRRRTKTCKNKQEVENQRMTHIAVERNRRKQMNEYLNVLRSLMPSSYVQRGDQASIVGGAINFVKELEQQLQSLEAQKRSIQQSTAASRSSSNSSAQPFADFFTFPQYSTCTWSSSDATPSIDPTAADNNRCSTADIEVTMVESHANLKVFCKRRPKLLLKMVIGLQNIGLTPLHLNVTAIDHKALYSFSLKVEDDCQFTSVDEVADFVHQMLGRIEQEEEECVGVVGVGVGFKHG